MASVQELPLLFRSLLCAAFLSLAAIPARADSLIGTPVDYSVQSLIPVLAVYGQPTGSFVIGDGLDFETYAYITLFDEFFPIVIDFTANGLFVAVSSDQSTANFGIDGELLSIAFTDPAFTAPFEVTDSEIISNPHYSGPAGGLNVVSLRDNTLTLQFRDLEYGDHYDLAEVVTPEPSSFALLGTGLLGLAGAVKRRSV